VIRTAVKFGVFVLVCLSFTMYLAFTIGNISIKDPLAHDFYTLNASFDDVTGLLVDDNVKIAGVVVGKVTNIKVVDGRARVEFTVRKSVDLGPKTSAAIRWRNLIGQRYVYLYPDTDNVTKLGNGDEVKTTRSVVDLGELFNRLGPIVSAVDPHQVNDFLDTVSQALDGNQDKVGQAITDLSTLLKGLASRDTTIARLVQNLDTVTTTIADRDQQIRVMLDNLVLISSTFSDNTQTLDTALQSFGEFSTNLDAILQGNASEIDRIINNLDLITTDVIGPKLGELDSVLKGVDEAARRIFDSSRLGEWLNQAILCADTGPPQPGLVCKTPILNGNTSGAATPGAAAPAADPSTITGTPSGGDIGSRAPTNGAGASVLQQLLVGGSS
jgi:phospholipid/cholesterol/gamma-HCH transport system substrate-binding protein